MSDHDEATYGQVLAYEEAKRLARLKPDHELLRYALHPEDDAIWEEFIGRFGKPGLSREAKKRSSAIAWLYAEYWIVLREACDELAPPRPGPITFPPRSLAVSVTISEADIPY